MTCSKLIILQAEAHHGMAATTLPAYEMFHPHMQSMGEIALGNFMTLETDWKNNGNKRLQSFSLETLWKQKRLQSQTMEKDWKLFHLQTKQTKKTGNFFTYKPNSQKKLETFSLTNQTMEKDWKLFHLQTKQWKTSGNNGKLHGKKLQTLEIVDRLFQWGFMQLL